MRRRSLRRFAPATALGLLLSGCLSEPESLIVQVEKAKEAVQEIGAETYAPDALQQAEDVVAAAEAEVAAQREKFVLMRNYTVATTKLTEALEALNAVAKSAAETRNSMKGPVRAMTKDATLAVDAAEQELAKWMASHRGADVTEWANRLASLRQMLEDASVAERKGDFITAKVKLDGSLAGGQELAAAIQHRLAGG
ncbi:MAG: hypothetical protein ACT4PE_15245 [Candidatus Eiseniibacteriota bacterium]